jgi:hypothetical protein
MSNARLWKEHGKEVAKREQEHYAKLYSRSKECKKWGGVTRTNEVLYYISLWSGIAGKTWDELSFSERTEARDALEDFLDK